jgi:hypothetical protein
MAMDDVPSLAWYEDNSHPVFSNNNNLVIEEALPISPFE